MFIVVVSGCSPKQCWAQQCHSGNVATALRRNKSTFFMESGLHPYCERMSAGHFEE